MLADNREVNLEEAPNDTLLPDNVKLSEAPPKKGPSLLCASECASGWKDEDQTAAVPDLSSPCLCQSTMQR